MHNPSRRNKNIGTTKQGHGQENNMSIPYLNNTSKDFYERLGNYKKVIRSVHGREWCFVIEETRKNAEHACSVEDVTTILNELPPEDIGELKLIVFRQPKRKEQILSPVWGRLIYAYEFEGDYLPAIILEAVDLESKFKWKKNLSVDNQKELARLKEDGHPIVDTGKFYEAEYNLPFVRNTQLYRTLLHEIGHYVHYLHVVERDSTPDEDFESWEKRHDAYFNIPKAEKEKFAHAYAENMGKALRERKVIPFDK